MSDKECVLFVPTGHYAILGEWCCGDNGGGFFVNSMVPSSGKAYRCVPFSLPAAVERVALLLGWRDDRPDPAMSGGVNVPPPEMQRAIRAAILGESEPEILPHEMEAARTWYQAKPGVGTNREIENEAIRNLAAHFARARAPGMGKGSALLGEGKGEGTSPPSPSGGA